MKRHVMEYIWGYTYKVEDPYSKGRCARIYIKVPKPEKPYGIPCIFVTMRRSVGYFLIRFRDPEAVAEVLNLQRLPKQELEKLNEAYREALRIYSEIEGEGTHEEVG